MAGGSIQPDALLRKLCQAEVLKVGDSRVPAGGHVSSLKNLRALTLGLPYNHPTIFGISNPLTLFAYLPLLVALESLQLVGYRSAISKDGHLIFQDVTNEMKTLLKSCGRLQSLEIVPCVGLSEDVFSVPCITWQASAKDCALCVPNYDFTDYAFTSQVYSTTGDPLACEGGVEVAPLRFTFR